MLDETIKKVTFVIHMKKDRCPIARSAKAFFELAAV